MSGEIDLVMAVILRESADELTDRYSERKVRAKKRLKKAQE